ncbi:MAG: hypothetical protein ACTSYM_05845 [Candidatus Baldrarchaeia archaeon]
MCRVEIEEYLRKIGLKPFYLYVYDHRRDKKRNIDYSKTREASALRYFLRTRTSVVKIDQSTFLVSPEARETIREIERKLVESHAKYSKCIIFLFPEEIENLLQKKEGSYQGEE